MLIRYHEIESTLAAAQVVFVMFGLGATLSVSDFIAVVGQPRSLIVGCACQFLLAPLLTVLVLSLCPLDAGVSIGLVLISAMPGGPLANFYTFLARGNVALSIAMTVIATFASLVTVPVLVGSFAGRVGSSQFTMPLEAVVFDVAAYLVAPLVAGMLIRRAAPHFAELVSVWFTRLGLLILVFIVSASITSGRIEPLGYGWTTPLVIVVLCLATQNLSMAIFLPFRWPVADQTAVGVGVTIRNINLALLLASRQFPATGGPDAMQLGGGVLYVVLFWGALSLVVCAPTIFVQRRALEAEARRRLAG